MRLLFSLLTSAYLKNFESAVQLLAERGHRIQLVTHEPSGWAGSDQLVERLCREHPAVSVVEAPPYQDAWLETSSKIRACSDYVQFLDPRYSNTYRARAVSRVPRGFAELAEARALDGRIGRNVLRRALGVAEAMVPPSPQVERFVARFRPHVVLLTPYVGLSTAQPAYLRAAHSVGARAAVCVGSWDHLTSKSRIRPIPDLVTVWNEVQRREAIEIHDIPPDRIVVTGAQCFDHWFDWQASPRSDFCSKVGLDPGRPYLLYTCFTPFKGEPSEADFVVRWLRLLKSSDDPKLAQAGVLIRPHPKRLAQWEEVDLSEFDNVVIWPSAAGLVADDDSKAGLFDSIEHSAGVVGINTSAMIEAGIIGRRVHTILLPDYWSSQLGTFHFPYMLEVGGGLLRAAHSFGEHLDQLSESIASGGEASLANMGFVANFIRPHGLDQPATPRFVDAIEGLAGSGDPPRHEALRLSPTARRALGPVVSRAQTALTGADGS